MATRVLITGGFGYLGGRIAVELAREPSFTVRLGSRRRRDPPDWLPEAETVVADVLEPITLSKAVTGVEAVVHLAALNAAACEASPREAVLVNTLGTLHALRAAIEAGVERFIYLSTAHVYGALTGHIMETTPPRPNSLYSITHYAAERFVLTAQDQQDIGGVAIRLSNGFGAPIHPEADCWSLLVNDLCRQAAISGQLRLRSSGRPLRNFITVSNVARAVRHVIDLPAPSLGDGLFNLGGQASSSAWEMAQLVAKRSGVVLGQVPTIARETTAMRGSAPNLTYHSERLMDSGFSLVVDSDAEVDRTLTLCRASFQPSGLR